MGPILLLLVIIFFVYVALKTSEIIGNWQHLFANMNHDPEEFYNLVIQILQEHQVPDFHFATRNIQQGSVVSNHRLYLEISRGPWGCLSSEGAAGAG